MAGLFDPTDPTSGGLMGMYANPNTAGMLGMAQGLLAASGPSRLPVTMGQAMGQGMQGAEQGFGQSLAMQQNMLRMRAMQGLMGGDTSGGQPQQGQGQAPSYSSLYGPNSTAPGSMAPAAGGMGGAADGSSASGAPATPAGPSIYGKTPHQLFQQGMLMNMAGIQGGGDLMRIAVEHDPTLAMQMPTDISKMGYQGGMTPQQIQQANAAGVAKANYIAPVNARPGAILRDPITMQPMAFNPNIPAGGTPLFDASGNVVGINSIPGAAGVTQEMAGAKTAGEGSQLPYSGVDVQGNPLPVTNRTQAATGNMPLPLRNNNPGAVSPGGSVAQYPDLQTGLKAMDGNLANYANDPKVKTLADAVTKWVGSPPNAPPYIKDVSTRLGIPPNTPIDLTNPAQRQALGTAIMLHENGPSAVFRSGGGAPQQAPAQSGGGQIYAAPPLGATTAANASQGAPSKQMSDAQDALASSDNSYQASRQALQKMISITQNGGLYDAGMRLLPQDVSKRMSNDAAEYLKAHSNFVSLQGKALGGAGTDASRDTLNNSVPTFDMPTDAKISGLNDQLNQLDWTHLKRQALNPIYQQGDEKTYTAQSAAFDKAIQPSMMPKLNQLTSMPVGPARTQALQQAIADPQMKAALDLMVQTGQLK